ncbi:hypothetical protein AGMMS50239_30420 [Bacteroidia bacterium]|nr:hypothetical protein AGMMS50239_30420 [Bacteroidia bacterium]
MKILDIFNWTKTVSKTGSIKQVNLFIGGAYYGNFFSIPVYLYQLDMLESTDREFVHKIREYLKEYEIMNKKIDDFPAIKSSAELNALASKLSKRKPQEISCNLVGYGNMYFLYVIEYGKPNQKFRRSEEDSKDAKAAIWAQNPLDSKYEKQAQAIIEIFKNKNENEEISDEDIDVRLRSIGTQLGEFNKMVLVAYRSEKLARDMNLQNFSTKYLDYAWDGLYGWMK